MTAAPAVEFVAAPDDRQIEAILRIIAESSEGQRAGSNYRPYAFLLKDASGAQVGGLSGYVLYDWMFVQYLAVADAVRGTGLGRTLVESAEAWGREQGFGGMWLETFAFQAPDFYRRLGFSPFGAIDDHPEGSRRIFFQKRFR